MCKLWLSLFCADVQELSKEQVPPEQQNQENLQQLLHIKEEEEELWTSQEGEQEADVIKFTFSPVPVKIEEDDDNEEKPQSSQLHQRQAEENRDGDYLEPDSHDKMSHSSETDDNMSEPETDDSCDWRETREPSNPV